VLFAVAGLSHLQQTRVWKLTAKELGDLPRRTDPEFGAGWWTLRQLLAAAGGNDLVDNLLMEARVSGDSRYSKMRCRAVDALSARWLTDIPLPRSESPPRLVFGRSLDLDEARAW